MFVCLPQKAATAFKKALKGKDIQIADLLKMSTEERTALFEKYGGAQAKEINTLFEEKLVLKNKVAGLKNFINKLTASGRYDPAKKAQLEEMKSEFVRKQQERVFNPTEEQAFLNDLADEIAGVNLSRRESKTLYEMTTRVDELQKDFNEDTKKWSSDAKAKEYGAAKVVMEKYVDSLKEGDTSVKELTRQALEATKEQWKTNKPKAIADLLLKTVKTVSDNSISLVATLDNSFMGRQGLKTLMTHPTIWWSEMVKKSFSDIAKTLGGQNAKDALWADIYSMPKYMDGTYDIAKLIPKNEEQYPTSLPERTPGIGRVFRASQIAFEGSAVRGRIKLYDLISGIAEKNKVDMTDKYQIESIGKMINSLTARGQWGKRGEPAIVRLVLWAPKMLKANIDVLTAHTGQDVSGFARKQAAINLVKIIATSAGIMMLANAIKPGSAETDPRSSNFGKIKIGNTTFDYTGGAGSLIVLAARQILGASKSNTTGLISPFGSGYGQQSRFDTFIDFLTGKTTPPVGAIITMLKGTNPVGQKATFGNTVGGAVTPISLQNAIQLKDDHSAQAVLGALLDVFGVNSNTYTVTTDWTENPGVELQAFQKKVGDTKFQQANDLYNKQVAAWLSAVKSNPKYTALSPEDKQKVITNKKAEIKAKIFTQYGFQYKNAKSKPLPKL